MCTKRDLLCPLLAVVLLPALGGSDTPTKPDEARAVKAVLEEQVAAWNAGDLDRFLATYWESEDLVFYSGGTISKGHKAVAARYRKNYQTDGKEMGKLTFLDMEVSMLGSDSAMARAKWKLVTKKETVEGLFTLVMRKMPKGWKIVHDHTSKADPPKTP
jgi:beta-aspartyl-peptidase (threonine type)